MKKTMILFLAVCFFLAVIPKSEAWVSCEPVTTTTTIYVYVGGGGGGGAALGLLYALGGEVAVLLAFSPWLIMYHNNPECRKEQTMGDMAKCVQGLKK